MKKIFAVLKKELRRFFTDKRMVMSIFLPGILIFFIYTLIGDVITDQTNKDINEFVIYVENEPTELSEIYDVEDWIVHKNFDNLSKEQIMSKVSDGSINLYIIYEENFSEKVQNYVSGSAESAPQIAIYYNSINEASSLIYTYTIEVLNNYEAMMTNKFDINSDLEIKYDLATEEDLSVKMIGMILPFILMTFLISGAMGICSESIAGEKERGTIATLLVTPIKRRDLVVGKVGALGITSMASAFVSFFGLILSLPKLTGTSFSLSSYGIPSMALLLAVVVITALFFTTVLTIVSTYAKSVKEASTLAIPLMLVVYVVGITGMMSSGANTNLLMYLIPVYNSIQVFTGILNLEFNVWMIVITIASNLVAIGIGVFILTKMFNSEKIMFNK